jgi:hypothetical protein
MVIDWSRGSPVNSRIFKRSVGGYSGFPQRTEVDLDQRYLAETYATVRGVASAWGEAHVMGNAQTEGRISFAETCRCWAAQTRLPFRREHLLQIARLSEQEAKLVRRSYDCIVQSKKLIAGAEILLRHRWGAFSSGGSGGQVI